MKRRCAHCSVIVILLLFSCGALSNENADPAKIKKALADVQSQMQKLEKAHFKNKSAEKSLHLQLAALDKEIGDSAENERQLQTKMSQHTVSLNALQNEEKKLQGQTAAQQAALSQLLQATFQHYRKEKLQLLLEQQHANSLARMNQYYQFFFTARAQQINELQNHLKHVHYLQEKILDEQNKIKGLALKLQANQKILIEMKDKRKSVLSELSKKIVSVSEELSQLQQQEQHLEQLFKALQKKLATTPTYIEPVQDFAKMKKKLLLPVQEAGAKLSTLPNLKNTNVKKTYISATNGTPVNAIFPGRVVFAEWLRGLGLLIIVDHGHGYMSLYGNNQKLYKGLGDFVTQGEMIARVGQSGGHAEPGLYFEIRKDGEALDPTPWFSQG